MFRDDANFSILTVGFRPSAVETEFLLLFSPFLQLSSSCLSCLSSFRLCSSILDSRTHPYILQIKKRVHYRSVLTTLSNASRRARLDHHQNYSLTTVQCRNRTNISSMNSSILQHMIAKFGHFDKYEVHIITSKS